jgi:hypothetical protein
MVRGLEKFKSHFEGFEGKYTLKGVMDGDKTKNLFLTDKISGGTTSKDHTRG